MLCQERRFSRPLPRLALISAVFILSAIFLGCFEEGSNIHPASDAGAAGSGVLTLTWDRVMAENFDLDMSTGPGGTGAGRKIPNVANPIQINDLQIGATYYFVLTAMNDSKVSARSPETSHTVKSRDDRLELPLPVGTTEIALAWDENEKAAAYNLYWRSTPGVTRENGVKIENVQNPHKIKRLIRDVPYYFVVTAVGAAGEESGVSEELFFKAE